MGDFEDKNFPDAVDSADVQWMMVEWKIRQDNNKCSDCGGNYSLNPNQFNDMPVGTTKAQALTQFRKHIRNRRDHNNQNPDSPRRTSLFLCRVIRVAQVTDDDRTLLVDTEIDRE
jgi:hypothetical protein